MCYGMELGWIRPCGRLGEGLGRLECDWSVPGMGFWIGESDGREQVRQHYSTDFCSGTEPRYLDSKTYS